MNKKLVNIIGPRGGWLSLILAVIFFFVLLSSLLSSFKRIREGDILVKRTREKVEKLRSENEKLASQLEVAKSEEYMEKQLRNKLGLVKEGEIILVLPDEETLRKLSPSIPEEEEVQPKANWQKWLDLFN